ncbi:MAG: 50S ribosomal protein L25/general stress protein Ctc [Gammaproteobacteria bacterium]|nr:50S ribosomal protein L25/general stress protein Ctc [Gammaproteobacteria bacterium]
MSSIKFELEAEVRADIGKGASRRLRNTNKVPAVVYGAGQGPISLTLDHNKVVHALSNEAFYSHILILKVGKTSEKVILKDVQRDPSRPRVHHLDFLRVRADQKLTMHVPLHFEGDEKAEGVKEGGVVYHAMNDIEISCLPADLPEFLVIDTSKLKLDETLHLSDIKLPKGVELTALSHGVEGHDLPVVSIHKPRMVEDEVAIIAEEEGTEAAEAAAPSDANEEGKKD